MKLVSVIMPVFNAEKYLSKSIESVISQSHTNLELLLIDDGSTDDCAEICDYYATRDERIKVFHIQNAGVSSARNLGIENSNGEYVTFIDSDDYINEDYIEVLVRVAEKNSVDCVLSGCKIIKGINGGSEFLNTYEHIFFSQEEIIDCLCKMKKPFQCIEITAVWATLYKKDLIQDERFNGNLVIGEDFEFKYRVFNKVNNVICIDYHGYNYFIHENSAMKNGFSEKKVKSVNEFEKLVLQEQNSRYFNLYLPRIVNIAFVILLMIPLGRIYDKHRITVIKFIKQYRMQVLFGNCRIKVRLALMFSYLGFDNMQRIFNVMH